MNMIKVLFLPQHKTVEICQGSSLLEAASLAGVPLEGPCGGKGSCGKCKVRILSDDKQRLNQTELKALSPEELVIGWRLACRYQVTEDITVEIPLHKEYSDRKAKMHERRFDCEIDTGVEKIFLSLHPPDLNEQMADWERIFNKLSQIKQAIDHWLLQQIPVILRQNNFQVTAVINQGLVVALEAGDTTHRKFGVAFDIGTTTILGILVDLNDGNIKGVAAATNPQNIYGADVISRITYAARESNGLKILNIKIITALNEIIEQLIEETGIESKEIYQSTVVGNTTMSHLFLGVDPTNLSSAPFVPAYTGPVETTAKNLGLKMNSGGRVLVLPNIAGYVGSDTVGVMTATRIDEQKGYTLVIDIGTNGEVVLAGNGRILTCSTAAGPAFEGAHIQNGMRAAEGAIEGISIMNGELSFDVIGEKLALGICGSGLIDGVAALLEAGVINHKGKIINQDDVPEHTSSDIKNRIRKGKIGNEFLLVPGYESANGEDIVICQKDVRELQLAKGAIHAGILVLLQKLGITIQDISKIMLAGAFGNYIKKESALKIGLFPQVSPERINSVGNAAGDGALIALLSKKERDRAIILARQAEHIELSSDELFQKEFIKAVNFK